MTLTMSKCGEKLVPEDEIFYSDDDSDSELNGSWSESITRYFNQKGESVFSNRMRQNSAGSSSPDTLSLPSHSSSYINSPINQISSGFQNLLLGGGSSSHSSSGGGGSSSNNNSSSSLLSSSSSSRPGTRAPSYSAIIKKEPLDNRPQINFVKAEKPKITLVQKSEPKKIGKAAETALAAGYRFKAREPTADPRYPADQQLMVGPIPGNLDHDTIYNNLRSIFQSRGPVCFMFIHKNAVKDLETNKLVKFGYVVFAEKGVAQRVVKEGSITFSGGHSVNVKPMGNNR